MIKSVHAIVYSAERLCWGENSLRAVRKEQDDTSCALLLRESREQRRALRPGTNLDMVAGFRCKTLMFERCSSKAVSCEDQSINKDNQWAELQIHPHTNAFQNLMLLFGKEMSALVWPSYSAVSQYLDLARQLLCKLIILCWTQVKIVEVVRWGRWMRKMVIDPTLDEHGRDQYSPESLWQLLGSTVQATSIFLKC